MKFLLIGNGFIVPVHKEAIKSIGGEIIDIIDKNQGEEKWKEEVKKTDADCIVILTPNDLHFKMAKFSAESGKIVLCEKPLVIKSEHARILAEKPNIYTVLQLRHHPLVKKLKSEIRKDKNYKIEMDISVYRDEKYYKSWKGIEERSGGLLFNLGIHYFDLLLYLFGKEKKVTTLTLSEKTGTGIIGGNNYMCSWRVSTDERRDNQRRIFKINNVNYNFSSQDNLSYANLHKFIYQDLLKGRGITPQEVLRSIELVEKLYAVSEK